MAVSEVRGRQYARFARGGRLPNMPGVRRGYPVDKQDVEGGLIMPTVEQAVLAVIIRHVEAGNKRVPVWEVEQAHPKHQLSGRVRLRDLRKKGLVSYESRMEDNTYLVHTSLPALYLAWVRLTGKLHPNAGRGRETERAWSFDASKIRETIDNL